MAPWGSADRAEHYLGVYRCSPLTRCYARTMALGFPRGYGISAEMLGGSAGAKIPRWSGRVIIPKKQMTMLNG